MAADPVPPASAPAATAGTENPMCVCGKSLGAHYHDGRAHYCTNPHHWADGEKPLKFQPAAAAEPEDDGSESGEEFDAAYWPSEPAPEPPAQFVHCGRCGSEDLLCLNCRSSVNVLRLRPAGEEAERMCAYCEERPIKSGSEFCSRECANEARLHCAPSGEEAEMLDKYVRAAQEYDREELAKFTAWASKHWPHHAGLSVFEATKREFAAQATELAALREALAKFGHHSGGCNLHNRIPFTEQARREYCAKGLNGCTCGLTAALAPRQPEERQP